MATQLGYYVVNVPDSVRGKAFYHTVLGWNADSGDDPHAYYHVAGSSPAGGINGAAQTPHITTYFIVDDAKAAAAQIRELGGHADEPVQSKSGWSGACTDDQGGEFSIWQPEPSYAPDGPIKPGMGDLLYSVLPSADDEKARRFYGELFGWEFTPGNHEHGWNILNVEPPAGLFGAGAGPIIVYFQVADIEAAVTTVKEAGGTPGAVQPNSKGWHADCVDDQGTAFGLVSVREA
jgi:predicted enzyme related to lactoylglutathione lyase